MKPFLDISQFVTIVRYVERVKPVTSATINTCSLGEIHTNFTSSLIQLLSLFIEWVEHDIKTRGYIVPDKRLAFVSNVLSHLNITHSY